LSKPRPKPPIRLKTATRTEIPKAIPAASVLRHADLWICLALLAITLALYSSAGHFDFVNFDDPDYVSANPHVRHGITISGILWAFTSTEAANWFPVTRLSHMLDCQIFGVSSGWHHLVSVFLHGLAAIFLFAFLRRVSLARWPSAWVAVIFAIHPLHVESVAWIAERKDVLCALFWFLTLWAYAGYAQRPSRGRYALMLTGFALGLMSKPMIVTLPLVLLLLDIWPLRRVSPGRILLREKMPLFVLSAASALITFLVQSRAGAVEAIHVPLIERVGNALDSYVVYVVKMVWPMSLAVFYPFPPEIPIWEPLLAGLLLIAMTVAAIRVRQGYPHFTVGWLWFVITLLPVIGLVQVGAQARADRYMYVPMVGLLVALACEVSRLNQKFAVGLAAVTALACIPSTWAQIQTWQNTESLFQHALDATTGNYVAHHNLGVALSTIPGHLPDAIAHYEASLAIQPDSARTHTDLGSALAKTPGRLPDAIREFDAALKITPDSAIPHNNLGSALAKIGRTPEAVAQFREALRLDPDYAEAHSNLGAALAGTPGGQSQAIAEYREALRIDPDSAEAHNGLGSALAQSPDHIADAIAEYETALRLRPSYAEAHANLGSALTEFPARVPEAISQYEEALRIDPDSVETHYNYGVALSKMEGRTSEAIAQFEAALRLNPNYAEAHSNLGVVLSNQPSRLPEAISHFEAALRIRPDYADAHYNLGVALSNMPGRMPQAIAHFEEALKLKPDPELRQLVDRLRKGK